MKILFINASTSSSRYFPLGVGLLMTVARQQGHEIELFDTNFFCISDRPYTSPYRDLAIKIGQTKPVVGDLKFIEEISFQKLIENLEDKATRFQPNLIAISVMSPSFPMLLELLESVKIHSDCFVAVGGIHCRVAGEEVIREGIFDFVFDSEAEESFPEFCRYLEKGDDSGYSKVEGLFWKDRNGEVQHQPATKLPDLNKIPILDLSFFDERYFMRPYDGKLKRICNIEFTRGCPYACTYCINSLLHEKYPANIALRFKTAEQCINELKVLIKRHNFEMFVFMDESFLSRPLNLLKKLAYIYSREIALPFSISTRPETINYETVKILKEMNCVSVSIGIESGSPRIRRKILNRKTSNATIEKAFRLLNENGIRNSSLNIIGIPTETEEDLLETVNLNRKINPTTISVSILFPYKGTAIRKSCIDKGYLKQPENSDLLNPICSTVLDLPGMTRECVEHYYNNFTRYCRESLPIR